MKTSNSYQDWNQAFSQMGFKHMEYLSAFHNRAFSWQAQFYKAPLKAAESVEELCIEGSSKGNYTLTVQDLYFGFQAFQQKELIALYQSYPYKQASQELNKALQVMMKSQMDCIEHFLLPLPLKMILHLHYPYYSPAKKSSIPESKADEKLTNTDFITGAHFPEKKKRIE